MVFLDKPVVYHETQNRWENEKNYDDGQQQNDKSTRKMWCEMNTHSTQRKRSKKRVLDIKQKGV